jgi:hypothetical protein
MEISQTPITEIQYLRSLMIDAGEIPEKSNHELMQSKITDQSSDTTLNVVEIRLKNALNIERKIILTYSK